MKFSKDDPEFQWIGEGFTFQRRGKKIRYESFSVGDLKVNVGDFVLVRNDDALDPEDIMSCYVVQVKELFDTGEETDSHQAQVRWYSRIPELPHYAIKSLKTIPDVYEVVEEKRSTWSDIIDAETVFQICDVIYLTIEADCETALSKYEDHPFPVFFCRYVFTGIALLPALKANDAGTLKRSRSLTSVNSKDEVVNGFVPVDDKKLKKAAMLGKSSISNEKKKAIYEAALTGNVDYPKVLIKRIDDRILESKNGNVRVFVADSSDETIENVTEKFLKKLNLEKNDGHKNDLKNRPIIHSLKSQHNIAIEQNLKPTVSVENDCNKKSDLQSRNSRTPKTRKKTVFQEDICPLNNKSLKKKSSFRSSTRKKAAAETDLQCVTPQKKAKLPVEPDIFSLTRSGRKVKSVNYSENEKNTELGIKNANSSSPSKKKIPHFVLPSCSDDSDSSNFSGTDNSDTDESSASGCSSIDDLCISHSKYHSGSARTKKTKKFSKKTSKDSTPRSTSKKSAFNLSIPERKTPLKTPQNVLEESRQRLHVSAVPTSLPCREEEYSDIYSFVKGCLCAQTGGCMYISGVPGTGKTATVHEVMRNLEEEKELGEVPIFTFVEVNGMWMTDPYQCYVHIFKSLTGKTIAPQQAADLLEKRFTERGPKKDAVVLLVDELDRLWTRKQTVMYNIFDWPSKKNSKLVVLAIANTMDLPERMMMNRISSRLGLTRKTFQPYTFRQLQEIIMSRIQELKVFDPDAVQLVSRKVAAVSGDARRALDICRFATEVVKTGQTPKKSQKILVGMEHVDIALQQMFSSPLISAIRSSSRIAKFFFQCMLSEFTRTGIEETTLLKVYQQVVATCRFEGLCPPNSSEISRICADLATSHLILVDNFRNDLHMKIRLNVSSDDVTYALTLN